MHTCTCQNADQMCIDHYQTAPHLGVHCLLSYITVPIFGVNTVLSCSKCDKYNNILIQVHCSNPKSYVAPGQLYASLGLSSSSLLIKKSM